MRKNTVCIFKLFYDRLAIRLICLSVARGNISSMIANTNKKERTLRASSFYIEAKKRKKNENGREQTGAGVAEGRRDFPRCPAGKAPLWNLSNHICSATNSRVRELCGPSNNRAWYRSW